MGNISVVKKSVHMSKKFPSPKGDSSGTARGGDRGFLELCLPNHQCSLEEGENLLYPIFIEGWDTASPSRDICKAWCWKGHSITKKKARCSQFPLQESSGGSSSHLHFLKLHRTFPGGSVGLPKWARGGHWSTAPLSFTCSLWYFLWSTSPFFSKPAWCHWNGN